MDARPPESANDIVTVSDEVKNGASSLKAPKDRDSGEAVNLKTKFCHFMRFRDLIPETMDIGERLKQ